METIIDKINKLGLPILVLLIVFLLTTMINTCEKDNPVSDDSFKIKTITREIKLTDKSIKKHEKTVDSLNSVIKKQKRSISFYKNKTAKITYIVDSSDVNIVNCDSLNKYKDTVIINQDSVINSQNSVIQVQKTIIVEKDKINNLQAEELGLTTDELKKLKKEARKLKRKLVFTKIVAGVVIAVTIIVLL